MSDNFGLKIGIEGEKEFKKALSDISQSFKVLGSEMNLITSQFDKQDRSIEAMTARNKVLNREIDTQKDKIVTLEKALKNATSSFGENDRRTKAWAIQLNNAKAELNGMDRELEQNNKALDKAASEFNDAEKHTEQFGDALKKSSRQADDVDGRFHALTGTLKGVSLALGAAIAAIGTAAVGAGKSLVDMTVSSAAYADEILTQASVTGMSTERLQAYKYAAELVDTDLETLTATMARNVRSMASASQGSGSVAGAYKQLGIAVTDAHGNLRDGETVYWEAIDALGKISNETERDALAMQIFGKSAQELNPLIAQGSAGMAALTEEAKKMGAVMSDDTLAALGKLDDSVQRLKSGASAAKNMLGAVLLPQLQVLADSGVSLLGEFTSGLAEAGGNWEKISAVIGGMVGKLSGMLMESLPKLNQVGLDIISAIGKAILDNLPVFTDAAAKLVTTLVQGFIGALPQIAEGALQLVLALADGVIQNLPALTESALQMIMTLAFGIGDALPKLIDALPEIISAIVYAITENLPQIVEVGINLIIQLALGMVKAIPHLVATLPAIIAAIVAGLGSSVGAVLEIGVNIVKGLWSGIISMGKWLSDRVTDFFSGIVDSVKGLLGIHSPSTVFEGIGGNMGKGVGIGFLSAMSDVERDMKRILPTNFNISATLSGLQPAYAGMSHAITYNHTGTIRVEGVSEKGMLTGVVDILIGQLRQEARL